MFHCRFEGKTHYVCVWGGGGGGGGAFRAAGRQCPWTSCHKIAGDCNHNDVYLHQVTSRLKARDG